MVLRHKKIRESGNYKEINIDGVSAELLVNLYRFMVRLRRCEEALIEEYHPANEMRCPVHFTIGQEAVSAALSLVLGDEDIMYSHHRSHGYYLAKKAPMRALFAELYGRVTGANGGKAGSQDISMASVNFYSGAILAGAVSIAVGSALAFKLQNVRRVAVTGFGEGATDEGVFWESVNYAALKKLPVLFVCENNQYATFSPQEKRQPQDNLCEKVAAFGLETHAIFGNDAVGAYKLLTDVIERMRSGECGPVFVQAYTYRWNGHVGPEGDDHIGYRPESDLAFWKDHCPIKLLEGAMIALKIEDDIRKNIYLETEEEIAEAFVFAKQSDFPVIDNWNKANCSVVTPMADKLLDDAEAGEFDPDQEYTVPGPY